MYNEKEKNRCCLHGTVLRMLVICIIYIVSHSKLITMNDSTILEIWKMIAMFNGKNLVFDGAVSILFIFFFCRFAFSTYYTR